MGVRRYAVVMALLLAGGAGLAAAPEALVLTGPERVLIGHSAVFTLQASAGTAEVVLTLPDGVTYESAEPGAVKTGAGGRNSGPCTVEGPVVTCTVDHPEDELPSWTATVRFADDLTPGRPLTLTATAGELTRTVETIPVRGADLAVSAEAPTAVITPGEPLTYTVVVRNLGPDPVAGFTLWEWFDGGWYRGVTVDHEDAQCESDPGQFNCRITRELPAGAEIRLDHVMPTVADDKTYGRSGIVELEVNDDPAPLDPSNDKVTFPVKFAPKPTPSPTPTTTTPAPGDGEGGGGGGDGGLPITGPATGPLVLTGVAFVLLGVAALGFTRRRRA
ncbi:hypothetical protein JIG36_05030 [Actinoplanes sp. LDG1-06]|uniref:Gram-positive cocci surface proteins LPxTG domain-containing protein n=1 Tax=Paractinoplanes ovalisporus TaxID=2810368 RepID=A0ABS2A509_9ACTN|nr:hypothetical protein [Actinoplanes ovalisporus]MBM2614921.1 hypothetical protein [Actinoplanes ovalisporus]